MIDSITKQHSEPFKIYKVDFSAWPNQVIETAKLIVCGDFNPNLTDLKHNHTEDTLRGPFISVFLQCII